MEPRRNQLQEPATGKSGTAARSVSVASPMRYQHATGFPGHDFTTENALVDRIAINPQLY